MAAASRDARLRQVNKERAQLQQTRLLGCEEDPELFFDDGPEAQRRAQRICWDCPVRRRCLDAALRLEVNGSTSRGFRVSTYSAGTVGGITSQVRNRLVRRRRQEAGYVKGSYRQAPEKETATTSRRSAPASSTYTERRSA